MKKNMIRLPITLVLLMGILTSPVVGGEGTSRLSAEDADWRTYVDEKWGFTIQYPLDWDVREVFSNSEDGPSYVIRKRVRFAGSNHAEIHIDVWQKSTAVGLTAWLDANQKTMLELGNVQIPRTTNAVLSARESLVLTQRGSCSSPPVFLAYVPAGDRMFSLIYRAADGGKAVDTYLQMLRSFSSGIEQVETQASTYIPEISYPYESANQTCYQKFSNWCCGYRAHSAKWPCGTKVDDGQDLGNCTWWAAYNRPDVGDVVWGMAYQWAQQAQDAGLPVDLTPRVGDIVVNETPPAGHVAYVTAVGATSVEVTSMGWCRTCYETATYPIAGHRFIHRKDTGMNAPTLLSPTNGSTVSSRDVTVRWQTTGSPVSHIVEFKEHPGTRVLPPLETDDRTWATVHIPWDGCRWHVCAVYRDVQLACSDRWTFYVANNPPTISFNTANDSAITREGQAIQSQNPDWAFSGIASDDDGIDHVEFRCWGNSCGNLETHRANGTTNWSYTRNGLYGHNRIVFLAVDTEGQRSYTYIDLYVDTAKPTTSHRLSGSEGDHGWYRSSVRVQLRARDNGSGNGKVPFDIPNHYRSGVDVIRYRIDNGTWRAHHGSQKEVMISDDGEHTVQYYAVDRTGNQEAPKSVTFKIDATAPNAPGAATESHGTISEQWQSDESDPAFTWTPASDATSGVWYYRVEWNDTLQFTTDPAYDPPAVRTGSYALTVRAVDHAGNVGPPGPVFTFRYDGTPPHAPEIQNNDGVPSGIWQNQVRTANFSWPTPHDEGAGVRGYYLYWGPDEHGTSETLATSNVFSNTTPICPADSAATYYLRVRSEDGVGLQSDWVGYTFRYDGAPPTANMVANYGQEVVHQTRVHLDINASDLGSGVKQMRLSNEGYAWSEWMDFSEETHWEIPAVGRRAYDIYLQLEDGAGNISGIISDTVRFDVNVPQPHSERFHLWDNMIMAGGRVVTSTNFHMCTAIGQSLDSPRSSSSAYILDSGFLAGALAEPTVVPTYTSYAQIGHLVASGGTDAAALSSTSYLMHGSLGQPSHMQAVSSTHFVATLGYWGGAASDIEPESPPAPPPPPPPECEFYSISINDGALFTRSPLVTLNLCGPDAVDVMLSNDGGFSGATWQPYTRTLQWRLDTYGAYVLPRFVYARFRDSEGHIHGTFFDDIIYDRSAPEGQIAFDPAHLLASAGLQAMGPQPLAIVHENSVEMFASVQDDSSGMAEMQVSLTPDFADATWEPYSSIVPVTFDTDGVHSVYVRFRDHAGNVSQAASRSTIVDTDPPIGEVDVLEKVIGPNAISVTLALTATDTTSSISDVRVSRFETFTDTIWVTYTQQLPVYVAYTGDAQPTVYAQFRDTLSNESAVYTATYQVDATSPFGSVEVTELSGTEATLHLTAADDVSAVTEIWLSPDFWFLEGVTTFEYQETLTWDFEDHDEVYAIFVDAAGNFSSPYWVPAQVLPRPEEKVFLPLILQNH